MPSDAALAGAVGIAVSPRGESVYVASPFDGAVSSFRRARSGKLSFQSCVGDTAAQGCSVPAHAALDGALKVAVSRDGKSVYVTSYEEDAVSHFARAADGRLSFRGCFAEDATDGCSVPSDPALTNAGDVTVSPDGKSVYVTAVGSGAVSHFRRASNGNLSFQGCFANTNAAGCSVPGDPALSGASGVVVGPRGDSVYVTAAFNAAISRFRRSADGDLSYQDCFANTNSQGCSVPGDPALGGARSVAISPRGESIYVTGGSDDSITHFRRATGGNLSYEGCFANTTADGCAVPGDNALEFPSGVAVSPDGDSVYVAAITDGAISHFTRAADGTLAFRACFADTPEDGCSLPGDRALAGADGVALDPGGSSLYVSGSADNAINFFARTPAARCAGKAPTKVGTRGADVIAGTPAADVIAALGGKDRVRGLGRGDLLCGGPGRDRLVGGAGRDRLFGQGGRDALKGGRGRDRLKGGGGRDRCVGGPGGDGAGGCERRRSI